MNKFAHLQSLLCRLEYRIDILLLRLKLFSNYTTVKKNLYDRIILINNKHYKFAISLVKGDVLSITSCSILTFTKRLKDCYFLHTFIEIDYYTKKIVVIKDLKALTNKDFLLLYRELYNTLDLRDYLLY